MENNDISSSSGEDEVIPIKKKKGTSNASNYKRNVIPDTILKGKAIQTNLYQHALWENLASKLCLSKCLNTILDLRSFFYCHLY